MSANDHTESERKHGEHEDERSRSKRALKLAAIRLEERALERRRIGALSCDLKPDETGFAPGGMV